jgi:protocatechuate 3,4-dioxygenase beta subunit
MDAWYQIFDRGGAGVDRYATGKKDRSASWSGGREEEERTEEALIMFLQEFVFLSDILGLSILVDSIDRPKPVGSTEGTVLGPFHTHDAPEMVNGGVISSDPNGEPLLVLCTVKGTDGQPIEGVKVDVWGSDSAGFYDVQHADRTGPDGRAVLRSDQQGVFWFQGVKPVPYGVPLDGPSGRLLVKLGRLSYRPSHIHFMLAKHDYEPLITYVPNY